MKEVFCIGNTPDTDGFTTSKTVKLVVRVVFMLFDESLAMKVILYAPVKFGAVKVVLYLSTERYVNSTTLIVPLGSEILANTLETFTSSVTLAAIITV